MQYVWNALSWLRCSISPPAVNPGEAPVEAPKVSSTEKGWRVWAAGTKRKESVPVPEEAKPVIAAIEEAQGAAAEDSKPAPVEEAKSEPAVEEAKPASVEETAPTVEETKPTLVEDTAQTAASVTGVATTLETIPEDTKLVPDDKKKVTENGASEEKDLGSEFTPHN